MSWGDESIYVWGGFDWGFTDPARFEQFFADAVVQAPDNDLSFSSDAVAQAKDTDLSVSADGVAKGTITKSFSVDALVARLPSEQFKKSKLSPILLVQIDMPNGAIRFSSNSTIHDNKAWTGKLINPGRVLRSAGQQQDDMRIQLDDTSTKGSSFSSTFSATNNPEGAKVTVYLALGGRPKSERVTLFVGKIEEVISITESEVSLEVVRSDAVDDRTLGRVVTAADFPNAPEESIGRVIPLVFGSVGRHEGIVTDFNARTALADALQVGETVAILEDGSKFPSSGSAKVDDEIITWTSKTGQNQLNISSRGDSNTQEDDHADGSELVEVGDFKVQFADHALDTITDIRLPDSRGNLVKPSPDPSTVDASNGLVTWSETPRILVPSRASQFARAAFSAADGANTAANPTLAARESPGFSELGTADVDAGEALVLSRSLDLGFPGEITKVHAVVVYDPTGFSKPNTALKIPGIPFSLGSLSGVDNTPDSISRKDYKTTGLTHDVIDPTHQHPFSTYQQIVSPRSIISSQGWDFPEAAIDGNFATQAKALHGAGNTVGAIEADNAFFSLPSNETVQSYKIRATSGVRNQFSTHQPLLVTFTQPFKPALQVVVPLSPTSNPQTQTSSSFGGGNLDVPTISSARWRIAPLFAPQAGYEYAFRHVEMELTIKRQEGAAATSVSQNRAVAQYFDITGVVDGDWSFFTDSARGDRLRLENNGSGTIRVLNLYYLIEFKPFVLSAGEVPRVFADCTGLAPDGDPVDVLEEIITQSTPVGLGLPPTRISRGSYNTAQGQLSNDSMRVDFSIHEPTSGIELIERVAESVGLRQYWDQEFHTLVRKPDPSNLGSVFRTFREGDIFRGSYRRRRTNIGDLVNVIETQFKHDAFLREFTGGDSQTNSASVMLFGERKRFLELSTVRDLATVQTEIARMLERLRLPRYIVEFDLYLAGIELRRGDLISIQHREFSFSKGEVIALHLDGSSRPLRVGAEAIVWEE